jgi:hypothetical protein
LLVSFAVSILPFKNKQLLLTKPNHRCINELNFDLQQLVVSYALELFAIAIATVILVKIDKNADG